MRVLLQDLRFAARMLIKSPGFTVIALITLTLGIGANTAFFSVFHVITRMSHRFADPDRLVYLWGTNERTGSRHGRISAVDFLDWRQQTGSFSDLALIQGTSYVLTGDGEPERIPAVTGTSNLLPTLGITSQLGRLHTVEEDTVSAERVVILSDALWERRFGKGSAVLGKVITLDDQPHTVIGVLEPGINEAWMWEDVGLWLPLRIDVANLDRKDRWYTAIARLDAGSTVEQAQAEMDGIMAQLATAYPASNADRGIRLQSLEDWIFPREARIGYSIFLAVAGLVLVIACANLASLLLVRASSRGREFAVRTALGAGRGRLIRQLLTESVLLTAIGGALGLLLGVWGIQLLVASFVETASMQATFGLNLPVLAYTLVVSIAAAVSFGLTPALRASDISVGEALKESSGTTSSTHSQYRLRNALVVGQMAVALPLLVCSGLLIRSLILLSSVDLGFNPKQVLTMQIDLPRYRYDEPREWAQFFREATTSLATVAGVESVGAVALPLGYIGRSYPVTLEGHPLENEAQPTEIGYQVVTPGYFRSMEIPLLSGRFFTDLDHATSEPVAIVNKRMADHCWPNDNPVGKRFRLVRDAAEELWIVVVGVVGNASEADVRRPPSPAAFFPHAQRPESQMAIVARATGDPRGVVQAAKTVIHRLDPDQPIHAIGTMTDLIKRRVMDGAVVIALLTVLGAIALSLACLGLYGVTSVAIAQRTHEIGVRLALGAQRRDILGMVLKRCLVLSAVAALIGLLLSATASRLLQSFLYEVSPADPVTFVGVTLLLLLVALFAAYFPARRATRVDPMVALRHE